MFIWSICGMCVYICVHGYVYVHTDTHTDTLVEHIYTPDHSASWTPQMHYRPCLSFKKSTPVLLLVAIYFVCLTVEYLSHREKP